VEAFERDRRGQRVAQCAGLLIGRGLAARHISWPPVTCLGMPHAPLIESDADPLLAARRVLDDRGGALHELLSLARFGQQRVVLVHAELGLRAATDPES